MKSERISTDREWLEPDGRGGFASGTAALRRTRRYHALLLSATVPPAARIVLVNGLEAWVETPAGRFAISEQHYLPDVVFPDGLSRLKSFHSEPWPRWNFRLEDGTTLEQSIVVSVEEGQTLAAWRLIRKRNGIRLFVRPLLSGRDFHSLHHENTAFRFEPTIIGETVRWSPYEAIPRITVSSNGVYRHDPVWYRNFLYQEERNRGLDFSEDLASPGTFSFEISREEAVLLLGAESAAGPAKDAVPSLSAARKLRAAEERRRAAFPSRLDRAIGDYVVEGSRGRTVVAGYPWFGEWGRDTFISLRGLCRATGRLDAARDILTGWAGALSAGMLPNRFPERDEAPEFNSVDAALWYVVAVHDFLRASAEQERKVIASVRKKLSAAVQSILEEYSSGTRFGIRADSDGLLAAGLPGLALTWMDARVDGRPVTPRVGKPVEVQALWYNALKIGSSFSKSWSAQAARVEASFEPRFWNEEGRFLFDVVDVDHVAGTADESFRPNQIYAIGGVPYPLVSGRRAREIVDQVEKRLWTPMGLRSLAPDARAYAGRYAGGVEARDAAYHQGTVWPYLAGAFVEAWMNVRGGTPKARREARSLFLAPLLGRLDDAGIGHLCEIADGDAPHPARGCPFQAWSVAELLRLDVEVLRESKGA